MILSEGSETLNDTGEGYSISEDLVASPEHKKAASTLLDFEGLLSPALKLHEDLRSGCGGQLWPAGMVLAKYLLRKDVEDLKNAKIIELGAGGGLVGLALASKVRPSHPIQLTDQLSMLNLMQRNIKLNGLEVYAKAIVLDWGIEITAEQPSVLLCAELVYFEEAFPLLLQTLKQLIGPDTICYFCFKKRRRADMIFLKTLKKNFDIQSVKDDPDEKIWSRQAIHLFTLRQKSPKVA